uniref:Aminopeptidase N n=1 Tax=Plodia interpunctella TaxID=58824 RepID=O17484_PLOIN|nr:aminopeptidase [Plodia interpunctella]
MAAMKWFLLGVLCVSAQAFPDRPTQRSSKTNIFLDEMLEGQIFENLMMEDTSDNARNDAVNVYRLPTTTKPYRYNIDWIVDTTELTFGGSVAIQLYATQAEVNEIVIQSDDLNILNVTLTRNNVVVPQTFYLQPEYDFLRVELVNGFLDYDAVNATSALYVLTINFEAELRHDMYGIYRSWFRNDNYNATPNYMATTQFQATSARRAFPCYDEPSFKATFDISIARRQDVKSWSCTRLAGTAPSDLYGPEFEVDTFYRTPIMSTYLLAIIVADYKSVEFNNTQGLLEYEVIARPAAIDNNQYQYAFDVGQELLAEMSDHTAIDYFSVDSNLKMTQAAIPDFGAGAMENWGLLTYREAYIMYHPNHTNSNYKQLIAYILSHEIAHMWFGNLVTCDWWDVLWLNEGFAKYYQYFLTHWVEDHMGFETRFITEQVHTALLSDSAITAHPLSTSGIGSPSQVSSMFSTLSYNKGAAIIRQTEHLLGFEVHRQGLRNYLAQKSFDTALPVDLFQHLHDAGVSAGAISEYGPGFSVVDYYRTWTEQGGHPVLNVQVDQQTGRLTISQRRFDITNGYATPVTNWIVPINFATASNPNFNNTKATHIMTDGTMFIDTNISNEWVILNIQQTAFYRVNYDDYTWNLIALALQSNESRAVIHEYNKAQIVNDIFQFARSGLMSYTRALSLLSFLQYETDYAPWVAAITGFNWLRNRFAGTSLQETFETLIATWATTVMADVTYYPTEGESFMQSYKRMQLAPTMCAIGVPECIEAAEIQFNTLMNGVAEVPVDSRSWVYCNALRRGDDSHFNFLWQRFQSHHVYTEKILLLSVLGCTNDVASLTVFLDAILEENYLIRRQDYNTAFNSAVTGNENNTQIVFKYVQENLEKLEAAYNVTSSIVGPLNTISARLRTEEEIEEFQLWARENRNALGNAYNSVYNGAESARASIKWTNEILDDVLNFIENGGDEIEVTTATPGTETPVDTETPPDIDEPTTPDIPEPDSAVTSALSVVAIAVAAIVNLAL